MTEWPNANQCFPGNRNYILDLCSATKFVELLITYHVFSIVSNSLFSISFIQKHKAWKTGWPLAHCEAKFSRISTSSCSILETDKLIGFRRSVGWIHHFAQLKTKSICQAFLCVHQTKGFDNFNMPRRNPINCSQCISETVELMARSCQGFFLPVRDMSFLSLRCSCPHCHFGMMKMSSGGTSGSMTVVSYSFCWSKCDTRP